MEALIPSSVIVDEALKAATDTSAVFFPDESVPVVLSLVGPAILLSVGTTSVNASVSRSKSL